MLLCNSNNKDRKQEASHSPSPSSHKAEVMAMEMAGAAENMVNNFRYLYMQKTSIEVFCFIAFLRALCVSFVTVVSKFGHDGHKGSIPIASP